MDPNNNQPQGDNPNLQKLEEDLSKLSQEAVVAQQPPAMVSSETTTTQTPPTVPLTPSTPAPIETTTVSTTTTETAPAPPTPPPPPKKGSPLLAVALVIAILAVLAAVAYAFGSQFFGQILTPTPSPVACTLEAKICPDGSSVGREGPSCDFAACPEVSPTPDSATDSATPTLMPTSSPTSSSSATPVAH